MFNDIGGKIKGLAAVVCWFGIFGSIIAAIAFFVKANDTWSNEEFYTMLGFVFLFAGPLFSWISSLFIYGFGELIDKTKQIYMQVADPNIDADKPIIADGSPNENDTNTQTQSTNSSEDHLKKLAKLHRTGLMTEEEFDFFTKK